ncbi:MAG: 3-hydroxyacyl-ACP dehydratase FabZ [Victivallaceae bacterium]|nr:3-hydroxyacyl-ACP dehydratase FabZ [Victivallaceae bacterium]
MEIGKILGPAEITKIINYRSPLLMLDRAVVENENKIIGVKNISTNEMFFQGHFPNHQIMPGVLQIEAMKQLAQLLVAKKLDPENKYDIYIRNLEKVKFRKPNNPGDRLKVEAELKELSNDTAIFSTKTSNNSGLTCQAVMTLAIRPKAHPDTMPELWGEMDKSADTVQDVNKIMSAIPHRFPFLLIDNVARVEADRFFSVKNVTVNEPVFQGYTGDYMIMPESYLCEIAAQSGCACVLSRPENAGKIGYFMSIDDAESIAPVFPGDQLICECSMPASTEKSRFGKGTAVLRVGEKIVFKIQIVFAIVDA